MTSQHHDITEDLIVEYLNQVSINEILKLHTKLHTILNHLLLHSHNS